MIIPSKCGGAIGPDRNRPDETDGSVPAAGRPSTHPAPLRISRRPHACIASRSDSNGTRRAATGKSELCTRSGERSGTAALEEKPFHFALQCRHRSIQCLAPGIDHNRPLWTQPLELNANRLAETPLDAVSYHRLTNGAGDGKTDARPIRPRLADTESREERPRQAGAGVVNSSEILGSQQTDTFRKTSDGILPLGAYRELFPAAGTTPRQNGAAVLGLHPRAESVRFCAMTVIRLKSAFWHLGSII
jgi:hypothetical protein